MLSKKKNKHTLGELEAVIMEQVWSLEQASVRQVLNEISRSRKVAYTTVMTVMSRLYEKGLLKRKTENNGYIYIPVYTKQEFAAQASELAIKNLLHEYGEMAITQFLDIVDNGEYQNLEEWKKKLKNIK